MSWKRVLKGSNTPRKDASSYLDGVARLKERDARAAQDIRTEIQKLLGEPPTWKVKPKIKRAPRQLKLTPEDAHAAMIFARYVNRILCGGEPPASPKPRRR